jgi:hypothetical protein
LALRLLAVIAVATAVAAITIGSGVVPWSTAPEESTLPADAAATVLSPSGPSDPMTQASLQIGVPASAVPAPGTSATSEPTGVPPVIPPLTVSLEVVNKGLADYTVNVTIINSAGSPQAWQNLTVHIDGLSLLIDVVGSVVDLVVDGNDPCFAPAAATNVGAGQTLTFSFTVTGAPGLSEPTQALLNQAAC